jgi:hypothetical protein
MELKNMLLPEKTVTFDFPGCEGFKIDLAFLSKESNQKLYKKCVKTEFNMKTRQPFEKFDEDMFLELFVDAIIKGWDGLKLKYLKELVLVDFSEEREEELLEYSQDNALELMKSSVTFDTWVSDIISDLGKFSTSNSTKKSEE